MTHQEIRETLEKQLQLLFERSEKASEPLELESLTNAMISIAEIVLQERHAAKMNRADAATPAKTKAVFKGVNPVYDYIFDVRETTEIKEVEQLLATGDWVVIALVRGKDGSRLFYLGRVR